jgi:hypothetical protein
MPDKAPQESASAHLRNALQIAEAYRHDFINMSDAAAAGAAVKDIGAMRDRVLLALEVIEQVQHSARLAQQHKTCIARSITIARVIAWL